MRCPSCGHQNRSTARFCDTCGAACTPKNHTFSTSSPSQVQQQIPWDTTNTGPGGVGWQPTPIPAHQLSSSPASTISRKSDQKGIVQGEAHYIQYRHEEQQSHILTFRLERYDQNGNRLQPVPVEMRGYSITGFINEGDQVRVSGTWRRGLLRAARAENATTGAVVIAKRMPIGCVIVMLFAFFGFFTSILILIIFTIFNH